MDKTRQNPSSHQADASKLLSDFLSEGRSEAAFRRLTEQLGKLVFSSALRRTGEPSLAEEVTQNVFTSLAKNAAALNDHPALLAWIFKTTQFESSKALRAERRRRRKVDALAAATESERHQQAMNPNPDDEPWRDAVPHLDASLDRLGEKDRQVVLQRFYQGMTFAEIASQNGISEGASKMRVKRTLEKLSQLLASRGIGISGAVIATSLSTELAKAAPINSAAQLAAGALSTTAASTAAAQTLGIMSTVKTVSATAAALVALAAIPFAIQSKQTAALEDELAKLQSRSAALAASDPQPNAQQAGSIAERSGAKRVTVGDLMKSGGPVDAEALFAAVVDAITTQDMIGMVRAFIQIAELNAEEYQQLMADVQAVEGNQGIKMMVRQMLTRFAVEGTQAQEMDRLMADGDASSASKMIKSWAEQDPDAAIAWFREKRASQELLGTAVNDHTEQGMFALMLAGIVRNDPAKAMQLYTEFHQDPDIDWTRPARELAKGLAPLLAEGRGRAEFQQLLASIEDAQLRSSLVGQAALAASPGGDYATAARFIKTNIEDPAERDQFLITQLTTQPLSIDEQIEAARTHLPDSLGAAVEQIAIHWSQVGNRKLQAWLEAQPPGEVRDTACVATAKYATLESRFEEALEHTKQIGDPEKKKEVMGILARRWFERDEAAARAALPAAMIEELTQD